MSEDLIKIIALELDNKALKKHIIELKELNAETVENANIKNSKWVMEFDTLERRIVNLITAGSRLGRMGREMSRAIDEITTDGHKLRRINLAQLAVLVSIKRTIEQKAILTDDEGIYLARIDEVLKIK